MARQRPTHYATLLRIRQRQEDVKAQALAAVQRQMQLAHEQRDSIAEERRRVLAQASAYAAQDPDISNLRSYYQYERHLARLTDDQDASIRKLKDDIEARRVELLLARKEKRVIEKLTERRMNASKKELRKFEQDTLDELAVNHAGQSRSRHGAWAGGEHLSGAGRKGRRT